MIGDPAKRGVNKEHEESMEKNTNVVDAVNGNYCIL